MNKIFSHSGTGSQRLSASDLLGIVHDAQTAWASGKNAEDKIIKSMTRQAEALGADAIVGLKLQLATVGGYTGVGTAVELKPLKDSSRQEYSH